MKKTQGAGRGKAGASGRTAQAVATAKETLVRRSAAKEAAFSVRDYPFFFMHRIIYKNNANIGEALKPRKLTQTIWRILAILQEHDGLSIGALSEESVIERTLLSRIISRLERMGLVRKMPDQQDKRYTAVYLSPAGRKLFAEILPIARRQIERAVAGLDAREREQLQHILRRITENLDRSPYE